MNELFFTRIPSFFEGNPLLESLDRDILFNIKNSPKGKKRVSLRTLAERFSIYSGENIRLSRIQYSLLKLEFMGLIIKEHVFTQKGPKKKVHKATSRYTFNPNTNQWVLYRTLRAVLNLQEDKRDLTRSSNTRDFKDQYHWVLNFEKTINSHSIKRFLDANNDFKPGMNKKLDDIGKKADLLNRLSTGDSLTESPLFGFESMIQKDKTIIE